MSHASEERPLPFSRALGGLTAREPLSRSSFRRLLAAILILGLAVRLVLIVLKGGSYHFADTAEYDAAARAMLGGHVRPDTPRAALYPAFMALVYRLAGPGNFPAVRLAQLAFGLGVIWLTAWLGRRIGTPRVGLLAALGVALAPTLVYTSTMLYPSALYTALILSCTLLAHELGRTPRFLPAIGFGAFAGLAWLTDPVAAAPIGALLLWILAGARRHAARLRLVVPAMLLALLAVVGSTALL